MDILPFASERHYDKFIGEDFLYWGRIFFIGEDFLYWGGFSLLGRIFFTGENFLYWGEFSLLGRIFFTGEDFLYWGGSLDKKKDTSHQMRAAC